MTENTENTSFKIFHTTTRYVLGAKAIDSVMTNTKFSSTGLNNETMKMVINHYSAMVNSQIPSRAHTRARIPFELPHLPYDHPLHTP